MNKLFFIIMFLFSIHCFPQFPGNVFGSKLWIKNVNDSLHLKVDYDNSIAFFNFNPVVVNSYDNKKHYNNIIDEKYTLFAVFKSSFEEERSIMSLRKGKSKVLITNKQVISEKDMAYKKVDAGKGFILSYLNGNNDKNGKKRNFLEIDNSFGEDKEGKEQLMEIIYYPELLQNIDRQKIETYLSLKYGISIIGNFDYLDSGKNKLWDSKENANYNNRVTGIGRDDLSGLYQKQSGNSEKDGIYIGAGIIDTTNFHNKFNLKDRAFLLWGDNGGKLIFTEDKDNKLKKNNRIWKIQSSGITPQDSLTTQLRINKKEFGYVNKKPGEEFLWMCINENGNVKFDYNSANYIKQSAEDDKYIYFNKVQWNKNGDTSDLFTFVQGPDFFVDYSDEFVCHSEFGNINLKIVGGTPPYIINFNETIINTNENIYAFKNLSEGTYNLNVSESKGQSNAALIDLTPFETNGVSLTSLWYMDASGHAEIIPTIQPGSQNLSYEWMMGEKILSKEKYFNTDISGDFILKLLSPEGCSKELPFTVKNTAVDLSSSWILHPNPVKIGEQFYVSFSLESEMDVSIRINSIEGKEIFLKSLGFIKEYTFTERINTAAVYLLTVIIGKSEETVKLIVN